MRGVIRRTAINLGIVLSPLIAMVAALTAWALIDPDVMYVLGALRSSHLPGQRILMAFAAGGVFALLQLRANHPWCRKELAAWCLLAGWDGRRPICQLAIRLHVAEVIAVGCLVAIESFVAGQPAVMSLIGWSVTRCVVLSVIGAIEGRQLSIAWVTGLVGLVLISEPLATGIVLTVAVLLFERVHSRALIEWVRVASMQNPTEQLRNSLTESPAAVSKLDPRFAQEYDLEDLRPEFPAAAWTTGMIALTSISLMVFVRRLLASAWSVDYELSAAANVSAVVVGLGGVVPVVIMFYWRAENFQLVRWWPSPGIRSRLARRRFLIWRYDCGWLSFIAPVCLGTSVLPDPFNPVSTVIVLAAMAMLIQCLGPNPVKWQLTAPAAMIRKKELVRDS